MAIVAGNFELAEVIKTHKDADVGEFHPPGLCRRAVWGCRGSGGTSPGSPAPGAPFSGSRRQWFIRNPPEVWNGLRRGPVCGRQKVRVKV